jgi:CheY-like chemotaxis protein
MTRILIVEDDFLVRMTLAEALMDEGFVVTEAENGTAALAALRADDAIGLLMTDVSLSGSMDGHALVRAVRQEWPALPVIYMTGRPEQVRLDPAAREMLVGKPYGPEEICAAARRMLD